MLPLFAGWIDGAITCFSDGKFEDALTMWNDLLPQVDETYHFAIHTNRGAALEKLGKLGEAIEAYDLALQNKSTHVDAWHNRGVALKAARRFDEALTSFESALANKADFFPSLRGKCDILTQLARYDEAIEAATAAVNLKPNEIGPLTDRAFAELKAKRLDDAIADYERAINEFSDKTPETSKLYAISLSQKAVEMDRMKNWKDAEA